MPPRLLLLELELRLFVPEDRFEDEPLVIFVPLEEDRNVLLLMLRLPEDDRVFVLNLELKGDLESFRNVDRSKPRELNISPMLNERPDVNPDL